MRKIYNFVDFINEELKNPSTFNFDKGEKGDKEHDRLASKKKDGHSWSKKTKKHGDKSMTQIFNCKCGYEKTVENDENKKVAVTYKKNK